MSELAWLVPVLARPHRVAPLLAAIFDTTPAAWVEFICSPDDEAEIAEVEDGIRRFGEARVDYSLSYGGYAEKINLGVKATRAPLIFLGADDLEPQPGWLERATEHMAETLAKVVGVNDLIDRPHRPQHATHFLMARDYAELPTIDEERGPLHEGYAHNFIDDELIETARRRGVYAYCEHAHVRHVDHPMTGGADDDTYRRGRESMRDDRKVFLRRSALWT